MSCSASIFQLFTIFFPQASAEKKKSCKDELEEARQRINELEEELRMKEEIIVELEGKVNS